jgi:Protein of unknown function (DUF3667)
METISQDACRNCGSRLIPAAHFCSECGQSAAPIRTTTLEIFHDWSEHYIGSHGALWRTLATLLRHPGKLTRDYIAGKRTMYLKPIQLYFLASILMFTFVKIGNSELVHIQFTGDKTPISFSGTFGSRLQALAPSLVEGIKSREKAINEMPRDEMKLRINTFTAKYIPMGFFFLLPVLTFFLKVLWGWRIRYADHFVFALHAQASIFIFLAVFYLGPKEFSVFQGVVLIAMLWTIWRAFSITYGGSWWKRFFLIVPTVAVYFLALLIVLVVIVFSGFALG